MDTPPTPIRVGFVTILPSPYQLDLFRALARQPEVDLQVTYLEEAAPDSPWPRTERAPYERVLPGFWVPFGKTRFHVNTALPDVRDRDVVVLSTYTSVVGQWLMRRTLQGRPWLFWGERMRDQASAVRQGLQRALTAPLHHAGGIVGIGSLAEADYRRRFPDVPFHANVPYYCTLEPFRRTRLGGDGVATPGGGEVTFFFCGQMIARKGVDLLLRAFDRLVGEGLPVRLVLVGREAELPAMLAEVSAAARARIDYRGFRPPTELAAHFADADVFVLPSRHDGWGVVVNQALGAGLPLLCSDAVGAAHDLIEPGVNGTLVEAGSTDALYSAMRHLATDPARAHAWGTASAQRAAAWTPEAGARRWVDVLQAINGRPVAVQTSSAQV